MCYEYPEQDNFGVWIGKFRDGISSIPDETVIPL
jgi:hypothetical protein